MKSSQITADELNVRRHDEDVKIVDGSWALDGTDMRASYEQCHIPEAVFFDLETISDTSNSLPHMAPEPEMFEKAVSTMGISNKTHVVVYDQKGLFSAARIWWTFRLMGHEKVQVLSGGLPAWIAKGFDITSQVTYTQPASYQSQFRPDMIIGLNDLRAFSGVILDARPSERFKGLAPEPRKGLRSGHIPGSHNLPFTELTDKGALRTKSELKAIFDRYDLTNKPVVTTCGSGVTAAILSMGLYEAGHTHVQLYDGSWAQWGQETLDTPVATVEA